MCYSHEGYNGMSRHMHEFVREHIVRGEWKHRARPVLLNSWEAAYFDINEQGSAGIGRIHVFAGVHPHICPFHFPLPCAGKCRENKSRRIKINLQAHQSCQSDGFYAFIHQSGAAITMKR